MFQNTAVFEKENLLDMQRRVAIKVIDRALSSMDTSDPSAQYDNQHGYGWDELLDHRNKLAAEIASHQT